MAERGVYKISREERDKQLSNNAGKYEMYTDPLDRGIGELGDVYEYEGKLPETIGQGGLLDKTVAGKTELSQTLNTRYWRNPNDLEVYSIPTTPSELLKRYAGKYDDYEEYMDEIGHLSQIRGLINNLATYNGLIADISSLSSLVSDGTDIYDALYNLNTYASIEVAMEPDRIGAVRDFDIEAGLNDTIITNVNNYDGKDSKLGEITSKLVSKTLKRAYQFNSTRDTKYITPELKDVYGLNAQTVHNFSDLFRVNSKTGRISDIELDGDDVVKLSADEDGLYAGVDDYINTTMPYFSDYEAYGITRDSNYNRYVNLVGNQKNISFDYKKRHNIFTPFDESEFYLGINISRGFSIDNNITSDEYIYTTTKANNKNPNNIVYYVYDDKVGTLDNENIPTVDGDTYRPISEINQLANKGENGHDNIIDKTQQLFRDGEINSLIARFCSDNPDDKEASEIQTAITNKYGLSRGRNLLTKDAYENNISTKENGYKNPYCRVWTYHHQYHSLMNTIRPFGNDNNSTKSSGELQETWNIGLRTANAHTRLDNNGVLNKNGLVNIAPTKDDSIDTKKCMFSIENLAWKDVNKRALMNGHDQILSKEQIGPNGGRIMWFPPYDLTFNETSSANWNSESFIGRGEPIYTYSNTERTGTLSFTILVDHPSIVDSWRRGKTESSSDDDEQTLLRFFAGCEELSPSQNITTTSVAQATTTETTESTSIDENPVEDTEEEKQIVFYVFYPNNYSGVNDEDAIEYLLKGKNCEIPSNEEDYVGYEMVINSEGGITESKKYICEGLNVSTTTGYGTRCDEKYQSQILAAINYKDVCSYGLNLSYDQVTNSLIGNKTDATTTLAEFYYAMTNDSYIGSLLNSAAKSRANTIKKYLKYGTVESMTFIGGASNPGKDNNTLSKNREYTLNNWIKSLNITSFKGVESTFRGEDVDTKKTEGTNSLAQKVGRYAKVRLIISVPEAMVDKEQEYPRQTSSTDSYGIFDDLNSSVENVANTSRNERTSIRNAITTTQKTISNLTNVSSSSIRANDYRYDYEKEYFSLLKVNDPIMHKKIIEKIKYFDPAFHSITPEGFNARLTFLHQCTRQGHTVSSSEVSTDWATPAGNLSFGRPPVCVLRIGDFFNTKVIINSVDFTYDNQGISWDMNPEGIGVQPMVCKVNLSLKFLGGSDLGGPVARLQNAVSFNYYANTSLYDNRSDIMKYDEINEKPVYDGDQWIPTPKKYTTTN